MKRGNAKAGCDSYLQKTVRIVFPALVVLVLGSSDLLGSMLRIGSAGVGGAFLPLWVAQDKGLFKKYGLDTEVITFQGGPLAVQSLLAGGIRFHVGGTSSIIEAKIGGADVVTLGVYIDTLPYILVSSRSITSTDQLRGKRFGVSRLGSTSDIALRVALQKLGIHPEKEAIMLGIGDQSTRFAALKAGTLDATVISPPLTIAARKLGFNLIASFHEAGVTWAYDSLDTTVEFARNNRQTVLNFVKGFIEALAFIRKNKQESLDVLDKWMRLRDSESLAETYDYLLKILPQKPYPTDEGIQAILDAVGTRNPKARKFRPRDFVDMTFLKELDRIGFLDDVFK
ncbi:MAG: ABC transporter substrate-binding protein [Deltaproteobacteria bacterium]|nr:ABC transporter substrate-binding protein [Deltaproteobacteria bacterium]